MSIIVDSVSNLGIDSKKICEFYSENWNKKISLSIEDFYSWQFKESPSDAGLDNCVIAYDDINHSICGVMGLNSRPFYLNNQVLNGAELTTWIVKEKYQRLGVGVDILDKIISTYDILIGMGISSQALPVYLRKGFRYIRAIPRFLKVYNFQEIEKYTKSEPLAKKLSKQWLDSKNNEDKYFEVYNYNDLLFSSIINNFKSNYNHFSRDSNFLNWRYANHPIYNYKQFIIKSKVDPGLGVFICFREEFSVEELRILHILDFFGDKKDMFAAIEFIDHYCKEQNIHLADFYCTSQKLTQIFLYTGWFSNNDDTFFQFPHLFNPIELRDPPTTSLIYWSKNNFYDLCDISKLYVTKQDCDFDRPTQETYNKINQKRVK